MADAAALQAMTEVAGRLTDTLFVVMNFYGLVVLAVVGWIVQTGKDSAGISWFRIFLFNLGLLFFFAAIFAAFWWQLEQLRTVVEVWGRLATQAGIPAADVARIAQVPPQEVLWGLWGFNILMLVLTTVLLRQGGFGRKPTPLVS